MTRVLFLLGLLFAGQLSAQMPNLSITQDSGVVWVNDLSWNEIKEKATKENKYIFVDVFTTWCGPCKAMDKFVFSTDTVGEFINEKFLAVKVQMDRTPKDNEFVKSWYNDAAQINNEYKITGYPTYLFFNPSGKIVHRVGGYMSKDKILASANEALQPGKRYTDRYAEFYSLLSDYNEGVIHYNRMPYMIQSAKALYQTELGETLSSKYLNYLESLPSDQLYTRDILAFLGTISLKSDSKLYSLFYPNGKRVDKVMGRRLYSSYAKRIIDRVILRELSIPTLDIKWQSAGPVKRDEFGGYAREGVKSDSSEADWDGLYKKIQAKYGEEFAHRGVLNAKLVWYENYSNNSKFYETYFDFLDRDGIDTLISNSRASFSKINQYCWFVFLQSEDASLLTRATKWMRKLVECNPWVYYIDTYASLLYKSGKTDKAIMWEQKAVDKCEKSGNNAGVEMWGGRLEKMKKGEKLWK